MRGRYTAKGGERARELGGGGAGKAHRRGRGGVGEGGRLTIPQTSLLEHEELQKQKKKANRQSKKIVARERGERE